MIGATLDIGSNSVVLLVGELTADGEIRRIDAALATTQLGAGLVDGGALTPAAVERTRTAVRDLAQRARQQGAATVRGFATGAARRARDGADVMAGLARDAGIVIEILSGDDEAALAYYAAADVGGAQCAVVDVGGGTTEITLGAGSAITARASLPLGALRLTEQCIAEPSVLDRSRLRVTIDTVLSALPLLADIRTAGVPLVASGGTATALAALDLELAVYDPERVHGHRLARAVVWRYADDRDAPGLAALDPGRAAILPAGAAVLGSVMDAVAAAHVVVSDRGVGYAYLARWLREESRDA